MKFLKNKPKLLLHICCVGCGAYISEIIKEKYDISLFFYNPNIYPDSEFEKRKNEALKIASLFGLKIIIPEQPHSEWLNKISGMENEPERGRRCLVCYEDRLETAGKYAKDHRFDLFTTTLTISPHKIAKAINDIGERVSEKYEIKFLAEDFKKKDGFKKSSELSRKLGLYRQELRLRV